MPFWLITGTDVEMSECDIDRETLDKLGEKCREHPNHCPTFAKKEGLYKLGIGDSRFAFGSSHGESSPFTDSCVVKLPRHESWGPDANETEVEIWEQVEGTELEEHLAEVVGHGDGWIVMPYGLEVENSDIQNRISTMSKDGLRCRDLKPSNFAEIKGDVKMVDYGDGCRISHNR